MTTTTNQSEAQALARIERAKPRTYCRYFTSEAKAVSWMQILNDAHAKGDKQTFVVAPGPEDNYAVMDLDSAIDLDLGYQFRPARDL